MAVEITTVADLTGTTVDPTLDGIHITDKSTNLFKEITGMEMLKGTGITERALDEFLSGGVPDLPTAVSSIGSTACTLRIGKDTSISANVTIPSTLQLRFVNGAKITIAATKTLTINALHDPGDVQIVSLAASSSLIRFGKKCGRLNVAWVVGGVGTTGTDAKDALDNLFASCTANGGGRVYVSYAGYTSTGVHEVTSHTYLDGFHSFGSQITQTVSDRALFHCSSGARYVGATNISLQGVCGPGTTSTGWLCEPDAGVDGLAFITFRGVSINGFHWGFKIHALDAGYAGQCVGVDFDNHCQFLSNDFNEFCDTPNTNIVNHALKQVSYDLVNDYPQFQADFERVGLYLATGEHTGQAKGTGTFTAVAATDVCTLAGHGFYTGMAFTVSNSGGALPTGLSAATTYYAIYIDGNTFYVASSYASAIAGTRIDITGAGSGTNTLTVSGTAAYGRYQTETQTIKGTDVISGSGSAIATVSAASMIGDSGVYGDPVVVYIPLTTAHSSAALIANAVREALMANANLSSTFHCGYVYGSPNECKLVFLDTGRAQVSTAYLAGTLSTGNITWTITKSGMTGSPLAITAAVLTGDSLITGAEKSAVALNANANFAATLRARAFNGSVIIETRARNAHDATMNAAFTGAGTTPAATSAVTTRGAAANDTTANFNLDPNGTPGMTRDATYSKATSVRTIGSAHKLAQGYRFQAQHSPVTFHRLTDEGIENIIINDSDELESVIDVDTCDLQGAVRLNRKCTFNVRSGRIVDRAIRDGGSDLSTYFGGPTLAVSAAVPLYNNFNLQAGNALILLNGRRAHNFANLSGDNRMGGTVGLEIDHMNRRLRSNFTGEFYKNEDSANYDNGRPALFGGVDQSMAYDHTKRALGWGTTYSNGEPRFLYTATRHGDDGGSYFEGPQGRPYSFYSFDGPLYAAAFIGDIISPTTIAANTNNWALGWYFDRARIRLNLSGNYNITGLVAATIANGAAVNGYQGRITNISSTYSATFKHDSGSSSSGNKIITPGGTDYVLGPWASADLYYDTVSSYWRIG